ncbi:AAA family ATPase [Tenggerimyces flavus]|uniref:AAA family ATPase n=1 Tax=Tenggerimyces flavus TaxID=1708749 RepID=A0ABV7YE25_9ACTN|nr:AAA family ATPase [Tenggerimyces flavus]MBM7788090.1 uncharacterized protein YhaN [Tenggerimyces flavus]
MRLHRLALSDFRGVERRELTLADTGVTVVVGNNETGKSSLLEALALLFDLPDDSKATRLRVVQPVGRDVGTEVEADLSLGSARMRYRKRWFRQRATELSVQPGSHTWIGREAHDEAHRLFTQHVDATLWNALVVGQGDALVAPVAGNVAPVLTALDEAAGGEVDHGASVPLVEAVQREYLRYFTRLGRTTGEYAAVIVAHTDAERVAATADARLAEVEQDVERAQRLARERAALLHRISDHAATVADLDKRRQQTADLVTAAELARTAVELASERHAAATGLAERRVVLVKAADQRAKAVAGATVQAREAAATLKTAERELDKASSALRKAREKHAAARADADELDRQVSRQRDRADLAELDATLTAVQEAYAAERAANDMLEQNPVDERCLERAESAHRAVLVARSALTAGAPKVEIQRLGAADVVVGPDKVTSERSITVDRTVTVAVDGVVEVRISPGDGVAGLAAALSSAEQAERAVLADLDCADVETVRATAKKRASAVRDLQAARKRLAERLRGSTIEHLIARQAQLAARLEESAEFDGMLPLELDDLRTDLGAARTVEADAAKVLAVAESEESQARKAFETASSNATATRVRAEQENERRDDAVAALATARDAQTDAVVTELVRSATATLAEANASCGKAEAALAASGAERVVAELAAAVELRDQLAEEAEELHGELRRIEGRLEMAGAQGLASERDRLQAELAQAAARRSVIERRALAARRLSETLARHRADTRRRFAAPLRDQVESLGRELYGPTFSVTLGEELEVAYRQIEGVQLPVTSLSTGAREQLAILVRLAIAGLTATDGTGVPVILDDALGWSDPSRLKSMGSLLAKVGESSQVLLLTSVPDRYAWVPNAKVIHF